MKILIFIYILTALLIAVASVFLHKATGKLSELRTEPKMNDDSRLIINSSLKNIKIAIWVSSGLITIPIIFHILLLNDLNPDTIGCNTLKEYDVIKQKLQSTQKIIDDKLEEYDGLNCVDSITVSSWRIQHLDQLGYLPEDSLLFVRNQDCKHLDASLNDRLLNSDSLLNLITKIDISNCDSSNP
jgi:hypothetical protein